MLRYFYFRQCTQKPGRRHQPALLSGYWPSAWISCPGAFPRAYGVYHFRKTFELAAVPGSFIVHVTADNRYRLFVNGRPVCSGPARGDLFNWYFESLDIAPYLETGKNSIAALVWNMGELAPVAQVSNQAGFVLQGNTAMESIINTNPSWKAYNDIAYTPTSLNNGERLGAYMVIGPGDHVDGAFYPWGWEQPGYDDSGWPSAVEAGSPVPVVLVPITYGRWRPGQSLFSQKPLPGLQQ